MKSSKTTRYKINKGIIANVLDKRLTIFDGENSVLYTFNETATFIYNGIKKRLNDEQIVLKIEKKYKISHKKAGDDFKEFIEILKKEKIIL